MTLKTVAIGAVLGRVLVSAPANAVTGNLVVLVMG